MYVDDDEFRVYFADKSTHFHSPLGICQALPSTCALSHVIPEKKVGSVCELCACPLCHSAIPDRFFLLFIIILLCLFFKAQFAFCMQIALVFVAQRC